MPATNDPPDPQPPRSRPKAAARRRWPRRLAIGVAGAVALFALVGFLVAPPIVRRVAEKQLGQLLGRRVSIARVRINPFALSVTVEGFEVYEPDRTTPFLGFGRLYVNAQLASVYRRAPVIKEIALQALRLHLVRTRATADAWGDVEGAYNFSDIVARLAAAPKPPVPPAPPSQGLPRFSLNNIHVDDGMVTFDDRPTGDHHEVTGLAIGVPFVSTLPVYLDAFVQPGLKVRIDGTPFEIGGRTKPFQDSLETVLELRLDALDLTRYLPFVPVRLPFTVDAGRLSLALDVGFERPRAEAPRLTVKGEVALAGLRVREKRGGHVAPLGSLDRLEVRLGESDVTAQRLHVERVLISGLTLHVRRQRDGTLNLAHLAPGGDAAAPPSSRPPAAAEESGPQIALDRFTLEKTVVHFRDELVDPPFEAEIRDVGVAVQGLSNARGVTATEEISLRAAPGGTIKQQGTLRLAPLTAGGKLALEGLEPARFSPYLQSAVAFDVQSGRVGLAASYRFEEGRGRSEVRVSDASVTVDDLALRRRGARDDFFRLGGLAVRGAGVDLTAHTVTVAEVATHDGRLRAARDARGVIDLTTLMAPPAAGSPPPPDPARTPAAAPEAPAWTVAVARFDLDRWGARFEDRAVTPAAVLNLDPIALHLTDVSTAPGAKMGLDLRLGINRTGRLQITGATTLPPVAASVRFDLRALEILPFQPYFADQVNLDVTGGTVGIKGQASVKTGAATSAPPQVTLSADLDVRDLATADRDWHEPLLGWGALHVGAVRIATPPVVASIAEISLTNLRSRLILQPDGTLNLSAAFGKPGSPAKAPPGPTPGPVAGGAAPTQTTTAAAPPAPAIAIGKVVLAGAQVTFTDRTVNPTYSAELTDLGGQVAGLSSVAGTTADVDLHGAVNRSGALTIAGKVNPLAKQMALDVQVRLKDVELPPASPYAAKYAGYTIGKGKLDLALQYKIADRKLDARNNLTLDQLTFADKVQSPAATKLPVRLAVALLKDRRGVIDLDLPIAGSLDDPDFKIGRAVLRVLGNLVVKAVTAPFSLIAAAFGGGDELSRIDFAPGAATFDAAGQKRLDTLAKVLRERPGISFEIEGGADPARDRDGLSRVLFERKLKAKKLAALVQSGAAVASVDDLTIDPGERATLLSAAYADEKFPKPKNALGIEKSLPPSEMERLMLANTRVDDDALRALALRRATLVQSSLARSAPGAAARLFLITPRMGVAQAELKLKKD